MNKVINVGNGAELFKILKRVENGNISGTTLNISSKAADEYRKLCQGLDAYGRSLVRERTPQYKQLIDVNLQVYDMIKFAEDENYRSLINGAIDEAKKSGRPFEFVYDGAKYVAEIVDGESKIKFLEVIQK